MLVSPPPQLLYFLQMRLQNSLCLPGSICSLRFEAGKWINPSLGRKRAFCLLQTDLITGILWKLGLCCKNRTLKSGSWQAFMNFTSTVSSCPLSLALPMLPVPLVCAGPWLILDKRIGYLGRGDLKSLMIHWSLFWQGERRKLHDKSIDMGRLVTTTQIRAWGKD